MKTSTWLLTRSERPAFAVAGARYPDPGKPDPPASDPLLQLLSTINSPRSNGRAWISRAAPGSGTMSGYVPADRAFGQMTISQLTGDVDDVWRESRSWTAPIDETAQRRLNGLRHRVFLDPDRFESILDRRTSEHLASVRSDGATYYVVLDLRFLFVLGQLRCHVSMAIFNAVPLHPEHRPRELARSAFTPGRCDAGRYRMLFEQVAAAAEALLQRSGYLRVEGMVGDGAYGLPVFWVVRLTEPSIDPMDYLRPGTRACDTTNHLAHTFLDVGHAGDSIVSHSVLGGDLLALRRPVSDPDGLAVPHYLILPGGQTSRRRADRQDLELWVAETVTQLTELETEGASRLLAIKADLEIWRNHLSMYNAVVDRAVFLWDALSTHLPIRRRTQLGATHRAMEMLHQMLLQTVGDLGHIATQVTAARADITDIADDLWDRFNAYLTERHPPSQAGLRAALTETGLFEHVKREAGEIVAEAVRVKGACDDLLKAVSFAFDERRAREFDSLQRFNYGLGFAVAMVALVTVLDATVQMKMPEGSDMATILGGGQLWGEVAVRVSWGLGLLLLLVGGYSLRHSWSLDKLGSRPFRRLYDGRRIRRWFARKVWPRQWTCHMTGFRRWLQPPRGVWQLLKDMSTNWLEHQPFGTADFWLSQDRCLAAEFAMVFDDVSGIRGLARRNGPRRDIRALSRQIEQWGMHALLLTERPRRMYRYPLPVLACLFRCCHRLDGWQRRSTYQTRPVSMMATEDFARSLTRLGFSSAEITEIDEWLAGPGRTYPSAADALRTVSTLGLKPAMTREERWTTLRVVRQDAVLTRLGGRSGAGDS
ncbi:MAG TPA: hypothetical protein VFZ32_09145 [Micromonosporaceae bacterium]